MSEGFTETLRKRLRTIPRSLALKLRVCDYPNPLRKRGIVLLRFRQCLEKSLADASGSDDSLCVQTVDLPKSGTAELRNLRPGLL